jgi:hypothetical protein
MGIDEMFGLALKVIADWRVVFATAAVLVAIALLRYVGLVYHKRPKTRARPRSAGPGPAAAGGAAERASRAQASGEDSDLID